MISEAERDGVVQEGAPQLVDRAMPLPEEGAVERGVTDRLKSCSPVSLNHVCTGGLSC